MANFVPAAYDLYEFDDNGYVRAPGPPGRRWFSSFNGVIGSPPQNVTLGWSGGSATVLVCTAARPPYDKADARTDAAHLALGGNELPVSHRPGSATATMEEMERIKSADGLWSYTPGVLPGGPAAETIICDGFALGYIQLDHGATFIAAVGLDPHQFKIRKVQAWGAYDVDATTNFPLSALRR